MNYERFISMLSGSIDNESDYRSYLQIAKTLTRDLYIDDVNAIKAIMLLIDKANTGWLSEADAEEIFNYIKIY